MNFELLKPIELIAYFASLKKYSMAEKKAVPAKVSTTKDPVTREPVTKKAAASVSAPLFEKENFLWMGIGAVVIAIGMILMAGGKNENANQFDDNLVYSFRRVTIAPILILLGLAIEIYAIFKKPKPQH
jgi:hypothetical protein